MDGETRLCGAKWRPTVKDPHWVCMGRDLVVVMEFSPRSSIPPAVIRRDLLGEVDVATANRISETGVREFLGGDHLHLVMPAGGGA